MGKFKHHIVRNYHLSILTTWHNICHVFCKISRESLRVTW